MKLDIFSTDFRKIHIKFLENPSSGDQVIPCGRTDRWTGTHDELIVDFRNFANAPENWNGDMVKRVRIEEMHAKCWSVHHKLVSFHRSDGYLPGFPSWSPGFDSGPVHVCFMTEKVTL